MRCGETRRPRSPESSARFGRCRRGREWLKKVSLSRHGKQYQVLGVRLAVKLLEKVKHKFSEMTEMFSVLTSSHVR